MIFFSFFPSTSRETSLTLRSLRPSLALSLPFPLPNATTPAGLIITSALMIWKSLILFTGSESPVSLCRFVSCKKRDGNETKTRHSERFLSLLSLNKHFQVVVVLSGSMEPGFHRGDILFLSSAQKGPPLSSGDIVVFNIGGRGKKEKS